MYEYEENPIIVDNNILDKIDIIENFANNTNCLKTLLKDIMNEDIYNSPRIEGNLLTKTEATYFLENDVTISGKPLRDFIQIRNQKKINTDYFNKILQNPYAFILNTDTILNIHKEITYGELDINECGIFRDDIVTLATTIKIPPEAELVPELIDTIIQKYYEPLKENETMFEKICEFKRNFELIHPFFDGNGRTGRFIMNCLFIQNNYPVITIPYEKRLEYFDSLENNTFVDFCSDLMIYSMNRIFTYEKEGFDYNE